MEKEQKNITEWLDQRIYALKVERQTGSQTHRNKARNVDPSRLTELSIKIKECEAIRDEIVRRYGTV